MKILKILLMLIGILVGVAFGFLWYMGFFTALKIEERYEGGYTVVGMEVQGPYSKVGKSIGAVDNRLKALGVISSKNFGIYYDDPKTTPPEKIRSFVGNVVDESDLNTIRDKKLAGLKIDSIPGGKAIVIEFPLKNMLSYMIGPMKVYPVLSKYMEEKKYKPVLSFEIYDHPEKKIIFAMQYLQ